MTAANSSINTPSARSKPFALGIIISVVLDLLITIGGIIWVISKASRNGSDEVAPFFISLFALFINLVLVPGILSLAGHRSAKGYWIGSAVFVGFVLVCLCGFIISH